ncbi:MaoC domain-containing protein dehydratase [Thecamonas trahens ATCC 50062]|uniref:MaoC domain-containing protein dehydratase n=1 Tax=Thecamonas trahens ATCC 50062 TaxID=461836 RepID=A0A0L0DHA9_THETB|nr:MaoC domain-containing protein dehydratase [Thecamonas trahens ATCC 50062]KNC51575.1 MaoC domain-containing protein dehydratase [Thecamonas trahens ATCC 50062]|eukprot:XP_013755977.1 MaoC domain-containing protein dehydratase [Thecamonas trahens ATCC 50062]
MVVYELWPALNDGGSGLAALAWVLATAVLALVGSILAVVGSAAVWVVWARLARIATTHAVEYPRPMGTTEVAWRTLTTAVKKIPGLAGKPSTQTAFYRLIRSLALAGPFLNRYTRTVSMMVFVTCDSSENDLQEAMAEDSPPLNFGSNLSWLSPMAGAPPILAPLARVGIDMVRLLTDPQFPFSLLGAVHARQAIRTHLPLEPLRKVLLQSSLQSEMQIDAFRPVRRGTEIDIVISIAHVGEERKAIIDYVVTILAFHTHPESALDSLASSRPPWNHAPLDELVPVGRLAVPAGAGKAFATVCGDRNPIHISPVAARLFGFPGCIAHGMHVAAPIVDTVLSSYTEPANAAGLTIHIGFSKPGCMFG